MSVSNYRTINLAFISKPFGVDFEAVEYKQQIWA